jgi:DNA-binding NtrC family response regulator
MPRDKQSKESDGARRAIYVDRQMWEKIALSLLSNTFRHSFEDGIRVSLRQTGEAVGFLAGDKGVGIREPDLPRLSERFDHVEGVRRRTMEETEISLALVHELVKLHGGSIQVTSSPDLGSILNISIPLGKDRLSVDRVGDARALASTAIGTTGFLEEALRWLPSEAIEQPSALLPCPTGEITRPPAENLRGESLARMARIVVAYENADMRDYVPRLPDQHYEGIKRPRDWLHDENLALKEEIDHASMFEEIVGSSPALDTVFSRVSKVACTDSTVLITGETGTGKELVARAIHRRSRRCSRAFVSVNCVAIPRDLIAADLFGHEKGAFTGATERRLGRFELADGGTLFLDEVGDLPADTQVSLLRALQERQFERVGGCQSIRSDVRVIAATNRDLQASIGSGMFRSDLFYRLNVFPIHIPPLRERREDILLLVEYFIDRYARKAGKLIRGISKSSLDRLQSYGWPGNVRELQNVIERSVILCETENFSLDESWLYRENAQSEPRSSFELSERITAQEREMIEIALRRCGGKVSGPSGAAARIGMPRSTLEWKIRSLKIDKNRFRA